MLGDSMKRTVIFATSAAWAIFFLSSTGTLADSVSDTTGEAISALEAEQALESSDPWALAESILEAELNAEVQVVAEGTAEISSSEIREDRMAVTLDSSDDTSSLEVVELRVMAETTQEEIILENENMDQLAATTLESVNAWPLAGGVVVHLRADGLLSEASYFPLEDPDRLVIDVAGVKNGVTRDRFAVDSEQVSRVRIGTHPDKIRIVLDGGEQPVDFGHPRMVSSPQGLYVSLGDGPELENAFSKLLMGESVEIAQGEVELAVGDVAPNLTTPSESSEDIQLAEEPSRTEIPSAALSVSDPALPDVVKTTKAKSEAAEVKVDEGAGSAEVKLASSGESASPVPASPAPLEAQVPSPSKKSEPHKVDSLAGEKSSDARVGFIETRSAEAARSNKVKVSSMAEVFGLQFERTADRDRVAILTDAEVEYAVYEPDAETVMIQISNARFAGDTGERITPESGGPVSLVTTFEQPELDGSEVRVVMRRAKGLAPTVTRRSTVLMVDFENTGLAASAPPAFLPDEPAFLSEEETYANRLETEGRLPTDSASLPGKDVDPDTAPVSELERGVAQGTADPHAVAAVLGEAEARTEKARVSSSLAEQKKKTKAVPAALEVPASVDVLTEGGLIDGKRYNGRRISLDFKEVLISDVLRLIAEVSDLNIIAGDEVKGAITIRLVDVPWDQALDVILLTKGLGFVRVGNVLRIAPQEMLKVEEENRLQERRQKEKLEDLEIKLQPVNYADVKEMKTLVSRLLSPRGTVNTDVRTNTVIIKDIPSVIEESVALIRAIDTQTPQVMIEAKIVEANLDFARELGSTWSFGSQPYVDGFNPGSVRTDLGSENFKFAGQNNVVVGNPITSAATGTVNFGAFLLDDKMQVDVHIQAMEQAGEGKVISSPRIVTLDNREAIIEQGVSIPFQTFESGDAKLEFIDAVLSLQVTPHITSDKSIIMALEVTRNAPDSSVPTPTGSPAIAKNQAQTETLVKDGQTLVIGGIYTIEKSTRESRVPYLSKIPFIGKAFMSRQVSDKRKELLIFVTPRIVVNPALASAQ